MKKNVGVIDKFIRLVIAAIIGYLYYTNQISGNAGIALFVLAIISALTAIFGYCPIYSLLGINSRKQKN